jgi:hypothetical protein
LVNRPGGITRGRHAGDTVKNEPYRLFSSTNPKFNTLPAQSSKGSACEVMMAYEAIGNEAL